MRTMVALLQWQFTYYPVMKVNILTSSCSELVSWSWHEPGLTYWVNMVWIHSATLYVSFVFGHLKSSSALMYCKYQHHAQTSCFADTLTSALDGNILHCSRCWHIVWWMRVGIDSPLSSTSILAFPTDLKRISEQIKPSQRFWSGCSLRQISSLSPCLSSGNQSQKLFKKAIKGLDWKKMAKLFGLCSCTAWAVQTGKHKHRVFPSSRCWQWPADLLNMCYHSYYYDTGSVWE